LQDNKDKDNKAPATVNTRDGVDGVMSQGCQMENDAKELMKDSLLCEPQGSGSRASEKVEEEGSLLTKLQKMVSKPLDHMPSLAVDDPSSADGVLQRPYGNGVEGGRDPSPDRNDSDSISAYEDASAETPEQDGMFLGEADNLELPDDSEKSSTSNCLVNDEKTEDLKNPEACVVS